MKNKFSFVLLIFITMGHAHSTLAQGGSLRDKAIYYSQKDPRGKRLLAAYPNFYLNWVKREDELLMGLSTAVHESIHHDTDQRQAYPLADGTYVKIPAGISQTVRPSVIYSQFNPREFDSLNTYISGRMASSGNELRYLFDEFNSYSNDMATSMTLRKYLPLNGYQAKIGLMQMMAFISVYADYAKSSHPTTWNFLKNNSNLVAKLWNQAEDQISEACKDTSLGDNHLASMSKIYAKGQGGIAAIIGRPLRAPPACLTNDGTRQPGVKEPEKQESNEEDSEPAESSSEEEGVTLDNDEQESDEESDEEGDEESEEEEAQTECVQASKFKTLKRSAALIKKITTRHYESRTHIHRRNR